MRLGRWSVRKMIGRMACFILPQLEAIKTCELQDMISWQLVWAESQWTNTFGTQWGKHCFVCEAKGASFFGRDCMIGAIARTAPICGNTFCRRSCISHTLYTQSVIHTACGNNAATDSHLSRCIHRSSRKRPRVLHNSLRSHSCQA